MPNKDVVYFNDDPSICAKCRTPKYDGIQEILFMPSTGECLFLDPEHFQELYQGKRDDDIPNLGEIAIEEIGENNELSEKDKAEKVNKVLFDSQKIGETQIGEAIKFAECIDLGDKKPIMVAKKFIDKLKKNEKFHFKLIETSGTEGEDIFKDFRIEVESETKKGKKTKILDKKIDTRLRTAFLDKFHPKVNYIENKIKNGKSEKELSDEQKKQLADAAKTLLSRVKFPEHIQKFIDGLQVELIGEWEKTYSVWKGERNWNNEESKKQILLSLKDPETLEKEDLPQKKTKCNQDDANRALRGIKDLWYKENDPSTYNDLMNGIVDANQVYSDEEARKNLINRVKQAEVPPALFEASASAAVMRMTAKSEGSFKSDITKGQVIKASGELSADMALAEGKANMKFQLPDENGFNAVLKVNKKEETIIWHELPVDNSDRYPANFHFDSSFVAPHTAHGLLGQLAALSATASAQGGKLVGLDIIGHTDAVGAASYNQALGMRRAEAAYDFLQQDYVGLSHNFQKGKWNKTHVEFMQAVVHVYSNNLPGLSLTNKEIPTKAVNLKEAIRNPDSIYSFTNYDNTLKLEEHHEFLKQNYPEYKSYTTEKVNVGIDMDMPNFRKGLTYINGYSNAYILGLLKEYRRCLWPTELNIDLNKAIRYRDGIISKGEQELKIDTKLRNEANRRAVLKGYLFSPQSQSTSNKKELDFGYFRMNLEGYASGYAGANIVLSGTANLSVDPENLLLKGIVNDEEKAKTEPKENKTKNKDEKSQAVKAEAEAKGEFFAGVKAEAGLKALLFWHESKPAQKGWWELGSVGYAINGSAGLSAETEFKIGYDGDSGRFIIKASASATLGIGGGGKVEFSVGLGGLWKFVQYVYKQIKENDFTFVDFFDDESVFTIFIGWHVKMLQGGINLALDAGETISDAALEVASKAQEILSTGEKIIARWQQAKQEREEVIALVESIENHKEMLIHATPEVKGRILYLLTQYRTGSYLQDIIELDINSRSEKAAVKLITDYIISKRDWQETFEHMATQAQQNGKKALPYLGNGEKGTTTTDGKLKENQRRMEENEIWLKTYLLNDADDWSKVIKKRNDLWK